MRVSKRVVITGGPAAGKTSAIHLLKKRFSAFADRLCLVPESATILYTGGFVRSSHPKVVMAAQSAIFTIQRSLEQSHEILNPNKLLVCDRGSLDGAAYWPFGEEAFFAHFGTTKSAEYRRYDAVLFFETSAVGEFKGSKGNPCRNEDREEAIGIDRKLRSIYKDHPNFHFVPHCDRFEEKLQMGKEMLLELIEDETFCEYPDVRIYSAPEGSSPATRFL